MSQSLDKSVLTEEKKENSLTTHPLYSQYSITNKTDMRVLEALKESNHNKTVAADKLGISFRSLRYRIENYGMT